MRACVRVRVCACVCVRQCVCVCERARVRVCVCVRSRVPTLSASLPSPSSSPLSLLAISDGLRLRALREDKEKRRSDVRWSVVVRSLGRRRLGWDAFPDRYAYAREDGEGRSRRPHAAPSPCRDPEGWLLAADACVRRTRRWRAVTYRAVERAAGRVAPFLTATNSSFIAWWCGAQTSRVLATPPTPPPTRPGPTPL